MAASSRGYSVSNFVGSSCTVPTRTVKKLMRLRAHSISGAPEPFTALNRPFALWVLADHRKEQHVALALMITLVMKMFHIRRQRMAE